MYLVWRVEWFANVHVYRYFCTLQVLERYQEDGDDFLLKAFNQSSYLEDLTGLTELHKLTEATEVRVYFFFGGGADAEQHSHWLHIVFPLAVHTSCCHQFLVPSAPLPSEYKYNAMRRVVFPCNIVLCSLLYNWGIP